jgi:hypothetical protein
MFWNLFRSPKNSKAPSASSPRLHLESLEDRTVPAVVPTVAGGPEVTALIANPVMSTAFAPLTNQLAGEVAAPQSATLANAQLFATGLSNTFHLGISSPLVNELEQALLLQSEASLFGAGQALLNFDPFLATNVQFATLFTNLGSSILSNPSFINSGGPSSPSALSFNSPNQLSQFLTGNAGPNSFGFGGTIEPGGTGTSVAGLGGTGFGTVGLSGTGFGSTSPLSGVGGLGNVGSFFFGTVPFYFSEGTASPDNEPSAFTSMSADFTFSGNSSLGGTVPLNADSLNYLAQTFSFIQGMPPSAFTIPNNFGSLGQASSTATTSP